MTCHVLKQFETVPYTVLMLDVSQRLSGEGRMSIDGVGYEWSPLPDLPHSAAILGLGNFVGKEIVLA